MDEAQEETECGYSSAPWEKLPNVALGIVLQHLAKADQICMSSTCKLWRDCIYAPAFWRKLRIVFGSKHVLERVTFIKSFLKYVHSLELIWPGHFMMKTRRHKSIDNESCEALLLVVSTLQLCTSLDELKLRLEHPASYELHVANSVRDDICQTLIMNRELKYISFGCHPLLIPDGIMSMLNFDSMNDLHLGTVRNSKNEDFGYHESIMKDDVLFSNYTHLQFLSLDWETLTGRTLSALEHISSLQLLSLFLHDHACCEAHPTEEEWTSFVAKNSGVKVSLVFINTFSGVCQSVKKAKNVHMIKILECSEIDVYDLKHVLVWSHGLTVRALVLVNTKWDEEYPNWSAHWKETLLLLPRLKYLTLFGVYVTDEVLVYAAEYYGHQLEQLLVSKGCIVTEAEATNYSIRLSPSQLTQLKSHVSRLIGKPWDAMSKMPLETLYYTDSKDDLLYMGEISERK